MKTQTVPVMMSNTTQC